MMLTVLSALFQSLLAFFWPSKDFQRGEDVEDAKATTEDLSVVQAERQADVSSPDTKAAIVDSLDKGTF